MHKKFIPISLLLLIGLAVVVSAGTMTRVGFGPYQVDVRVEEGWNLIAGIFPQSAISQNSDIRITDFEAVWSYVPALNRYYQVYPVNEFDTLPLDIANQIDEDEVLTSGMWVYSNKAGTLRYSTLEDYPPLPNRKLFSGWNFVSMTPDMYSGVLDGAGYDYEYFIWDAIKGSCTFENIYYWNPGRRRWVSVDPDFNFGEEYDDFVGMSMVVKVSRDCALDEPMKDTMQPPQIPSGPGSNQLRIDIGDYYYDEFSYEDCVLNNYQGFNSKQSCEAAWRCLANEFKDLVSEKDLEDLAQYMKERGGEMGYMQYAERNPRVKAQLVSTYDTCLAGRHKDY